MADEQELRDRHRGRLQTIDGFIVYLRETYRSVEQPPVTDNGEYNIEEIMIRDMREVRRRIDEFIESFYKKD